MKKTHAALALCSIVGLATVVGAHSDDRKLADRIGPYEGTGWTASQRGGAPNFDASGVELLSWLTLSDMNIGSDGSDCWGYVSTNGREYALFGHFNGTTFVDVTEPTSPSVVADISGPSSLWRDIKTFGTHAYIVSEGGSGVQVIDLSQIDQGIVNQIGTVNDIGTSATHNVAINTDSGHLYRCGGASNGLRIYDLSDPANPQFVGIWSDRYVHDAQIVTMQTGPLAGREIAFCCSGFNGGFTETGLDILDVTDKNNIVNLGRVQYPQAEYSHQVWLSDDEQFVFLNDELEEQNRGGNSRTVVIDVSDLADPAYVGRFENDSRAITHNNYVADGLLYAANYQSGMRIFDVSDPANGNEIAFFDTFPNGDSASFNGLWSVYPYFPSGTIIGSDIERGLFVWRTDIQPLEFAFPEGLPTFVDVADAAIRFDINALFGGAVDPETITLNYRVQGQSEFQTRPATNLSGNTYIAEFGPLPCDVTTEYFVSAASMSGTVVTDPPDAPVTLYESLVISNVVTPFFDNMETDTGWTVGAPTDTATTGIWERVDPVGTEAQPEHDASEIGTLCWITGQGVPGGGLGDNDVDGGATTLISPVLNGTEEPGVAFITYKRWYSNDTGAAPNADTFFVNLSNDGGESWVTIEAINQNAGEWVEKSFRIDQFLTPTNDMRIQFVASDFGNGSIVEAGVDDVGVTFLNCDAGLCPGDCDGSGAVDFNDLTAMLFQFGAESAPCDADGSGSVDFNDLTTALFLFGPCE